jgi:hypothetical protein
MTSKWSAELYDKNNAFVAELPFEALSVEFELNGIPKATIRVSYAYLKKYMDKQNNTVQNAIAAGFRYVDLKRNSITIFKGILIEAPIEKFETDINLTLVFKGWLAYFEKRFITKKYTSTDSAQIAWDIINTMQAVTYGNIGVTQGTIDTTVNRDRDLKDECASDAIIGLSNSTIQNGFEFEITNNKVMNVKTVIGTSKPYLVFDRAVIQTYRIDYFLGLSLTNKIFLIGEGLGDAQLRANVSSTSTFQSNWYLLEKKASYTSVKESATLIDHGTKILNNEQEVSKHPSLTLNTKNIDISEYDVGDTVKIEIEDIINSLYRIKKKGITVQDGEEVVSLEFL